MVTPLLSAALLLLAAQQAPPPKPGFKTSVTLVEVDVVATDTSGRPVRGLLREDFAISGDGRAVEIGRNPSHTIAALAERIAAHVK